MEKGKQIADSKLQFHSEIRNLNICRNLELWRENVRCKTTTLKPCCNVCKL